MTREELVSTLMSAPEIVAIPNMSGAQKETLCSRHIDLIARTIIYSWPWDFACNIYDLACNGTDTDFEIEGEADDCRRIVSIRYGETAGDDADFTTLRRFTNANFEDWITRNTVSSPELWISLKPEHSRPKIRVLSTPASGYSLRIRYAIGGLAFEDIEPDIFDNVIDTGVRAKFAPVLWPLFEKQLAKVMNDYEPGIAEEDPAMIAKTIRKQNQARTGWQGY
jgi:hypothetical protein